MGHAALQALLHVRMAEQNLHGESTGAAQPDINNLSIRLCLKNWRSKKYRFAYAFSRFTYVMVERCVKV